MGTLQGWDTSGYTEGLTEPDVASDDSTASKVERRIRQVRPIVLNRRLAARHTLNAAVQMHCQWDGYCRPMIDDSTCYLPALPYLLHTEADDGRLDVQKSGVLKCLAPPTPGEE